MSKTLSLPESDATAVTDLVMLLGGEPPQLERDYEEEAVQCLINKFRGLLMEAVTQQHVTPSQLAERLGVDRSLVTRFFRSNRDMKVSTLAIMALALNREWRVTLYNTTTARQSNSESYPTVVPFVTVSDPLQQMPTLAAAWSA